MDNKENNKVDAEEMNIRSTIKRLKKQEKREREEFRTYNIIQTTRVVTTVNCYGVVGLVFINFLAFMNWFYFSTSSIKTFLGLYIFIGGMINVGLILLHSIWEEWYVAKRAEFINEHLDKIRNIYIYKIEEARDAVPHEKVKPRKEKDDQSVTGKVAIAASKTEL